MKNCVLTALAVVLSFVASGKEAVSADALAELIASLRAQGEADIAGGKSLITEGKRLHDQGTKLCDEAEKFRQPNGALSPGKTEQIAEGRALQVAGRDRMLRGSDQQAQGRAAVAKADSLEASVPPTAAKLAAEAKQKFDEGYFEGSLDLYQQAINASPQTADYRVGKATVLVHRHRFADAGAACAEGLRLDGNHASGLRLQAWLMWNGENTRDRHAIRNLLTRSLSREPLDPLTLRFRAQVSHALTDYPLALADLEKAISVDSNQAEIWSDYGRVLISSGKTHEAHAALLRAYNLSPRMAGLQENLDKLSHKSETKVADCGNSTTSDGHAASAKSCPDTTKACPDTTKACPKAEANCPEKKGQGRIKSCAASSNGRSTSSDNSCACINCSAKK